MDKTPRWDARVVYGDTDSMFVLLKGRSTEEAFKIGEEICDVITKMNPSPVRMNMCVRALGCLIHSYHQLYTMVRINIQ